MSGKKEAPESLMSPQVAANIKVMVGKHSLPVEQYGEVIPPIINTLNGIIEGRYIVVKNPDFEAKGEPQENTNDSK